MLFVLLIRVRVDADEMHQMRRVLQMNEKEMVAHIKALTKVIEKQNSAIEQMNRRFASIDRQVSLLSFQVGRLQGLKFDE